METYALIGYPLGHSFSARYFAEKFRREGISARYINLELPSISALPKALHAHPDLRGFNVTIPYKQAILPYLSELSAEAAAIGAVNTVKVRDGRLIGYNTDCAGFRESLRLMLPAAGSSRALVLGTGGAARAVWQALRELGIPFTRVSRRVSSGAIDYESITADVMARHNIIVNATPLGTTPRTGECAPLPYRLITHRHICFDLVYNPPMTLFLRKALDRGALIRNGLRMLHLQAEAAWERWQREKIENGKWEMGN